MALNQCGEGMSEIKSKLFKWSEWIFEFVADQHEMAPVTPRFEHKTEQNEMKCIGFNFWNKKRILLFIYFH